MKKAKTSQKGRKCRYPGCKHILSVYNHGEYCYTHLRLGEHRQKAAVA